MQIFDHRGASIFAIQFQGVDDPALQKIAEGDVIGESYEPHERAYRCVIGESYVEIEAGTWVCQAIAGGPVFTLPEGVFDLLFQRRS